MLMGRDPQSNLYSLQHTIQNPFLIYSYSANKFNKNMTKQYECSSLPEGILLSHNHLPIDTHSRK